MTRLRLASLALVLPLLAVLLLASTLSGPGASAARYSSDDALETAQADPGAATVSRSVTMSLAAGGNLIGWPGFPTTTSDILAGNADLAAIWSFSAASGWVADAPGLPPGVATSSAVSQGTGLFVVASAATDLVVPTALVSTTVMEQNPGEVEFWRTQTNPSASTTSVLTRTPDGLHMLIETDDLFPGAYTGWWRIWNEPSACEDLTSCAVAPFGSPERAAQEWIVHWATGFVVGDNGIGTVQAFLGTGFDALNNSYPDRPEMRQFQLLGGTLEGGFFLDNPDGAHVDFVLKWHGEVDLDPDVFFDQLHSQNGSCPQFDPQGTFGCIDIQRADLHTP